LTVVVFKRKKAIKEWMSRREEDMGLDEEM
jgi:hypothetical protein